MVKLVGVTEALVAFVMAIPAEDMLIEPFTPFGKNPPLRRWLDLRKRYRVPVPVFEPESEHCCPPKNTFGRKVAAEYLHHPARWSGFPAWLPAAVCLRHVLIPFRRSGRPHLRWFCLESRGRRTGISAYTYVFEGPCQLKKIG